MPTTDRSWWQRHWSGTVMWVIGIMAAQVPVVAFFAIKWLPRNPKQALQVLTLQVGAYLASLVAVFFLT